MPHNFTPIEELVQEYKAMKYGAGSQAKEMEMPMSPPEASEMQEFAEQETNNAALHQQMVSKRQDSIKLPPDLKKIGLKTDEDDQFKAALNKIKLPISDDKIMEDLQAPPSEARRWYATILLYILERAHLTLKKVGTKAVRMFKIN
ncbi:MAG: hypothetical protein NTV98_00790 [Candidatus Roizmanbacteria bacterium]|nr:hypothetical protein [Candidatus Roizmanbacteria bacterium]